MVLTDIRHEDSIIWSLNGDCVHHLTHQQRPLLRMDGWLDDFHPFHLVERLERIAPFLMLVFVYQGRDGRQRLFTIGNHCHIGLHVLVNLAMVDVEVNNLRLFGVGLQVTSHAV